MGSPQRLNRVTTERFLIFALLSGPRPELAEKHIIGDDSERLTSLEPFSSPKVQCRTSWPRPIAEPRLLS